MDFLHLISALFVICFVINMAAAVNHHQKGDLSDTFRCEVSALLYAVLAFLNAIWVALL